MSWALAGPLARWALLRGRRLGRRGRSTGGAQGGLAGELVGYARAARGGAAGAGWAPARAALEHGAALLDAAEPGERARAGLAAAELALLEGGPGGAGHAAALAEEALTIAPAGEATFRALDLRAAALLRAGEDAAGLKCAEALLREAKGGFWGEGEGERRMQRLAGAMGTLGTAHLARPGGAGLGCAEELLEESLTVLEHAGAGKGDFSAAPALYQGGLFSLLRARDAGAVGLFQAAFEGATAAAAAFEGCTGLCECAPLEQETRAAALGGAAQAAIRLKSFEVAEERLSEALEAQEALFGEGDARVGATLLLLGLVYFRTQRVTLAEGLLRKAGGLLGCPGLPGAPPAGAPPPCHPSLQALALTQLREVVGVNEKRTTEAEELDRAVAGLLKPSPGRPRAKAGEYPSFASGAVLDVHLMRAWTPAGLAQWFGEQRLQSHEAAARRRGAADK